jgi:hypothetical protein
MYHCVSSFGNTWHVGLRVASLFHLVFSTLPTATRDDTQSDLQRLIQTLIRNR